MESADLSRHHAAINGLEREITLADIEQDHAGAPVAAHHGHVIQLHRVAAAGWLVVLSLRGEWEQRQPRLDIEAEQEAKGELHSRSFGFGPNRIPRSVQMCCSTVMDKIRSSLKRNIIQQRGRLGLAQS